MRTCVLPILTAVFVVAMFALLYVPLGSDMLNGALMLAVLLILPAMIVLSIKEIGDH